jgi:predicted phage terminase large subunit-like protein
MQAEKDRRAAAGSYRQLLEGSLAEFVKAAWPLFEGVPLVWNWHLDVICDELERITWQLPRRDRPDQVQRFLIGNLPPRSGKSSVISACWAAWTWIQPRERWGPLSGPHVQFMYLSYNSAISVKDARKTLQIVQSAWYRENWPHVWLLNEAADKFVNNHGGHRIATSISGTVTGEGGHILVPDDLIGAEQADSQDALKKAADFLQDRLMNRLNDPVHGAIVLVMQRMHAADPTSCIMERSDYGEWRHLMLPMEYDPVRADPADPREYRGELLDPERWDDRAVARLKLRTYAWATQYQQEGRTRDGEIIKQEWWQMWPAPGYEPRPGQPLAYPPTSFRVLVVDTATKEKEQNDWNAWVVLGVWHDPKDDVPRVMLMEADRGKMPLTTPKPIPGSQVRFNPRDPSVGLVERLLGVARNREVDAILIEDKTRGHDAAARLAELTQRGEWQIVLLPAVESKIARAHSVVPMFTDGMVYSPSFQWADDVIAETVDFPNAKHDDYADCVFHGLTWLWNNGLLKLAADYRAEAGERLILQPGSGSRDGPYD